MRLVEDGRKYFVSWGNRGEVRSNFGGAFARAWWGFASCIIPAPEAGEILD